MGCTIERWTAKATGSGEDRVITVRGEGKCTSGGNKLSLEARPDGIVDEPDVVTMQLVIDEPGSGTTVMTDVSVEEEVHDQSATRVRIRTADGIEGVDVKEA
jgi:hypothetical protein